MAVTQLLRDILAVISSHRKGSGESYIAGGTALNLLLAQPRRSRDIDIFHDTRDAVQHSWDRDRGLLTEHGFSVEPVRELPALREALVRRGSEQTLLQWTQDSAFRFFPLVEDRLLGLSLHPFDLATNKVLALVGRLEVRDWIDVVGCSARLQHLGFLAWAACGKDPGLNPDMILSEAVRSGRYTQDEVALLDFEGPAPDAAALAREWKKLLAEARVYLAELPVESVGQCVLNSKSELFRGPPEQLRQALRRGEIRFHRGSIRGAFPSFAS
jgi:hypothetical protein